LTARPSGFAGAAVVAAAAIALSVRIAAPARTAAAQTRAADDLSSGLAAESRGSQSTAASRGSHPIAPKGTASSRAQEAEELAAAGKKHLDRGEVDQAIELLSESVARSAENEPPLAWLVLAYARHGDLAFASTYLEMAAQVSQRPPAGGVEPAVYHEIGDRFSAANDLESAVLAWRLYRRSGGSDTAVLSRLDRAGRELSASPGQHSIANDEFTIFADESVSAEDLQRVERTLAYESERQSSLFGLRLPAAQVVILYGGRRYFSLVSIPSWVSGVFDGKIRISVDVSRPLGPEIDAVLAHELAHAFIREGSKGRAPVWLHEGLAQWCSGRRIPRADFRAELGKGRSSIDPTDLEMHSADTRTRTRDAASVRAGYAEALGLVEYLVSVRGEGSVFCLVRDLGEGLDMAEALRREAGMSQGELVAAWRRWAGL
jgi:hypothetical protein